MTLTIITINRNNKVGLEKTVLSLLSQTCKDFQFVIVDGASTDDSLGVIQRYANLFLGRILWVSEPDKGIYNAMNKGIRMAGGEYIQFLNSGDCLFSDDVVERMLGALKYNNYPSILYGNMLKDLPNGTILRDKGFAGREVTFLGFYTGTLNHSSAYIKKELFNRYGFYDESLRIVSDWKWYLEAIIFGQEKPVYTDIDVSLFDMNGISETNKSLDNQERRMVLEQVICPAILVDYDQWAFSIVQMKRLKRHPWAYKLVCFIERCLFKKEKYQIGRSSETQCV